MNNKLTRIIMTSLVTLTLAGCSSMPLSSKDSILKKLDDTTNPDLHEAIVAYQEGRLSDAETFYLRFLEGHEQFPEAWLKLGNVYFRTGRYDAAITAYNKALKYDKQNEKAWHNLALSRVKQAQHTLMEAEQMFAVDDHRRNRLAQLRQHIQLKAKTSRGSHIPKRYRKPPAKPAKAAKPAPKAKKPVKTAKR